MPRFWFYLVAADSERLKAMEFLYENTWVLDDAGVRVFVLAGEKRALVIDTGRSGLDIRAAVEAVTPLPYELLVTHSDPDHIAGNQAFSTFYMHPSEASLYYHLRHGAGAFLPVYDGDVLDLGGRELEIVHIPGHTPGSISVLDRRSRCLIGGDPIQCHGQIYMFGPHRDLRSYLYGLQKIQQREDFDLVYPSHADLPVKREVIPELIAGAEAVLAGSAAGRPVTMHGTEVMAYTAGRNILLCEK